MKQKNLYLAAVVLISASATAQIVDVTTYEDCSKNGYTKGYAPVDSAAGRTYCEWVQLWEDGPKWATFNVGATIIDYANLTAGTDATSGNVAYYNTANVGGLYAWNNPNFNGRKTTWTDTISTGIADVATTLWGSHWETPTCAQLAILNNDSIYTTWLWCDGDTIQYVEGCKMKGFKVSGKGNYAQYSIFLPVAGFFNYKYERIENVSKRGSYVSSTNDSINYCYYLGCEVNNLRICRDSRNYGASVRAILVE